MQTAFQLSPSKLPKVGTTIFAVMSKLAAEHGAINLSQGFPDFPVSEELVDKISYYMKQGYNQYAPMPGVPALRESISNKVNTLYSTGINADEHITITAGATEALFSAIAAVVSTGDEVIIFEPAYDSYIPAIELNGGRAVPVALQAPSFAIDWTLVKSKINAKTKAIIINSPHNPTGSIIGEHDLDELEALAVEHQLIVISDEVYEHIIFDKKPHQSILKRPGIFQNGIAVFSFGKTFHATGWKIGYVVASKALTTEIRKVHQFLTFSVNTPMQWAMADYLKTPNHYLALPDFYQQKRDYFLSLIARSRFKPVTCSGTYFQLLDYSSISKENDTDVATLLTQEYKVASIPVSVFYSSPQQNHLLRFCFAKSNETLQKAAEILCKI